MKIYEVRTTLSVNKENKKSTFTDCAKEFFTMQQAKEWKNKEFERYVKSLENEFNSTMDKLDKRDGFYVSNTAYESELELEYFYYICTIRRVEKDLKKYEEYDSRECGYRICSECGCIMEEGYVVVGGESYFCNDECLHKNISEEDWKGLTAYLIDEEERTEEEENLFEEHGDTDCYYTCWY